MNVIYKNTDVNEIISCNSSIEKMIDSYKVIEYDKTNIYIIENIIDSEFCDDIIEIINKLNLNKDNYYPGNNVKCYSKYIDSLLKMDDTFFYEFSTDSFENKKLMDTLTATNHLNGFTHKNITDLNNKINNQMNKISKIMKQINDKIMLDTNAGYCLRKIYGKTRNHSDGISEIYNSNINFINDNKLGDYRMIRNASIIMSLNDNYKGGEFKFTYQNIKVKLKKGSVIIFPPYWTHPHETEELIDETYRYTINTWSCQKIN